MRFTVAVAGRSFEIEVDHERLVWVNGHPLYVDLEQVGGLPLYSLVVDDTTHLVFVEKGQEEYRVEVQGKTYPVEVSLQRPHLARRRGECPKDGDECLAICVPLAGHLLSLPVDVGDSVEAGQVVAVVESMKMQMELKAPKAGIVEAVCGASQRAVGQGEELIILRTT
jgi:biotin carboxyl carrier protein